MVNLKAVITVLLINADSDVSLLLNVEEKDFKLLKTRRKLNTIQLEFLQQLSVKFVSKDGDSRQMENTNFNFNSKVNKTKTHGTCKQNTKTYTTKINKIRTLHYAFRYICLRRSSLIDKLIEREPPPPPSKTKKKNRIFS